jgi:HD-like signal output (HDOD) protein/CheY-like chemotaxis protein
MNAAKSPATSPRVSQGRILVVDDEEPIRIALGRTLRRLGFEVSEASDAEGGLAAIATSKTDVVFVDLRMPKIDGHGFLQRLGASAEADRPPVIVMSGEGKMDDVIEILRRGAVDYLRKPWSLTELISATTRAMEIGRKTQATAAASAAPPVKSTTGGAPDLKRSDRFAQMQVKLRQGEIVLPAIPSVLSSLRQTVEDPKSSITDIAAVIERDSRITADILRVSNTPQFAHLGRATNAKAAVTRLGLRHVHNLVQTIFMQGFCELRNPGIRQLLTSIWRRSVARAVSMRAICDLLDPAQYSKGLNGDTAYLIGLMGDVGASLLLWVISEKATGTLTAEDVQDTSAALDVVRRNHEDLGRILLERWNFEKIIPAVVASHHRDAPPAGTASWWSLFVLGDHLATTLVGEPDPTSGGERDESAVERAMGDLGIPQLILERLVAEIAPEYEAIHNDRK